MARLARAEPRLDIWQRAVLDLAGGLNSMATATAPLDRAIVNLLASYGRMAATMPHLYASDFSEHGEETLALGSLTGIRYFSLDGTLRLHGARGQWEPGENTAECLIDYKRPVCDHGPVPDRSCGCGFWAYWAPDPYNGTSYLRNPQVAGMIKGTGRYRAGTKGFRCAKAKILALCVQDRHHGELWRVSAERILAAEYKVPVYSEISTMMKAFPPSRQPQETRAGGNGTAGGSASFTFAGGGNITAGGGGGGVGSNYTTVGGGGGVYYAGAGNPLPSAIAYCPCGKNWDLAPGTAVTCYCGRSWTYDGYRPPVLHDLAMKQPGIGETGSG